MIINSFLKFIGHFHPLLVHLPIGILLIGLLFQLISRIKRYNNLQPAVPLLMLFGAISAILSCITGFLLAQSGEYDGSTLDLHMWMGIGVAVVAVALYVQLASKRINLLYKVSAIVLFFLLSATGHLGGTLTHGTGYLMSAFSGSALDSETEKVIPDVQEAVVYSDIVQPILQTRCYSCHGPDKQKGKYRMDSPELLVKGGKEGSAIIPGSVEESELIRRLLLPLEDKHHMAPDGKPQLTENQIALLNWWIEQGADFTKKVKDIEQPEAVRPMLLALQNDQQDKKEASIIPSEPVDAANENDIQKLKDVGVVVMPVSQNSNFLMANFVMSPEAGDKEVELLSQIKEQLVWLKLGNTKISDAALAVVGTCTNLTQLQLNNTAVSDVGIESLKSLSNLQSLNLVGTKVTAKGVSKLNELKNLSTIYIYQSAVDKGDFGQLQQLFATTLLDTGGYHVPTLSTDTTLIK